MVGLVSLACAILRDDEWFLSGFWTSATFASRASAGRCSGRCGTKACAAGRARQFVWASIDPTAIATYMKFGMLPGSQLFAFAARLARTGALVSKQRR
jgi:hypothetical protein